jgi:hypothetical protein
VGADVVARDGGADCALVTAADPLPDDLSQAIGAIKGSR